MSDLAIIVPVLRRPQNVRPLLESIAMATPSAHVVFVADPDDDAEIAEIRLWQGSLEALYGDLTISLLKLAGNYAKKINYAIRETTEPLIFTGADDLRFSRGWLEIAAALISDEVGVVGTNDRCNRRVMSGDHSTHSLVARWYVDEHGTFDGDGLLHEGYDHSFCDDELVQTAMRRGMFAAATDAVVAHLHPMRGHAPDDEVYRKGREKFMQDKRLFRGRLEEMRLAVR